MPLSRRSNLLFVMVIVQSILCHAEGESMEGITQVGTAEMGDLICHYISWSKFEEFLKELTSF